MNAIIEKIRAEVNKLPEEYKGLYKQFGNSLGFIDGLDMVKKILSDLEKEEKPVLADLVVEHNAHEKEVNAMLAKIDMEALSELPEKPMTLIGHCDPCGLRGPSGVDSDKNWYLLDQEIIDWCGKFNPSIREEIQSTAYHFADWQKEKLMENALHGWLDEDNEPPYDLNVHCEEKIPFGKFKHNDKVKLIIVKEDWYEK